MSEWTKEARVGGKSLKVVSGSSGFDPKEIDLRVKWTNCMLQERGGRDWCVVHRCWQDQHRGYWYEGENPAVAALPETENE